MSSELEQEKVARCIRALSEIREHALQLARAHSEEIEGAREDQRPGALNLLHYLSLRQHDIRALQIDLASLGLSSLGRSEAHTLAAIDAVLRALQRLAGHAAAGKDAPDFAAGSRRLESSARALLGPAPAQRAVRIMVTMPSEAATQPELVRELLRAGMNVMRITCAHDEPRAWLAMVANLRRAEAELGLTCRVMFDLGGPKIRTGALSASYRVVKLRPRRDPWGKVLSPARLWLVPRGDPAPSAPAEVDAVIPVDPGLLAASVPGDTLEIGDARSGHRPFHIVSAAGSARLAEGEKTTYVDDGAHLRLSRQGAVLATGVVGPLPAEPLPILLQPGHTLLLTRDPAPGRPELRDAEGEIREPARIPCTLGEAFGDVRPGDPIFFDDGKIGGEVLSNDGEVIAIRVLHTAPKGSKLLPDKGINLPESDLCLPAMTEKDHRDLEQVAPHADLIGLSFVRAPEDVHLLQARLRELGAEQIGVVLKIETARGFANLPRILLAGLRSPTVGVMVARGDLAVELGFERLAEVQEEILWLCEAAHAPVIWATQVLENMAKTGMPSRAEVTDAAMSGRAECVMLNKGPHMFETVRFLSGVLERMQAHQHKKTAMLRKLSVSELVAR